MMHMKKCHFTAYKTADAKFSWSTFDWEKYGERTIFLSVPSSAFVLDRPEKSCAHVLLEHTEYEFILYVRFHSFSLSYGN